MDTQRIIKIISGNFPPSACANAHLLWAILKHFAVRKRTWNFQEVMMISIFQFVPTTTRQADQNNNLGTTKVVTLRLIIIQVLAKVPRNQMTKGKLLNNVL